MFIVFFKKSQNVATIPLKRAWSKTNHGNSTPTRRGFENTVSRLPSEQKRDGQFLPNILTANNSANR